ncbi:MAG: PD-(D/E)XK nuclease family protein [Cyclobacteriaceae bacterium]|nr:PD-(D/E)XK nuclease family protein [Cyclobacteriaceae bacterium]
MKSFLSELAESVLKKQASLDGLTIVFPNRRAILYFRKHLADRLDKPAFAPRLVTIEEFFGGLSPLYVPDRLELVHRLYQVYSSVMSTRQDGEDPMQEPFDQFYFWGDMLLRDFDEVDKYRIQAAQLFRDLSNQKELDSGFDFLTEEQLEYLRSFWGNFSGSLNENKRKFLRVWRLLPAVYEKYREHLLQLGMAYDGLLQRQAVESLESKPPKVNGMVIFAGFNALTGVEEKLISHFVSKLGAQAYWDMDAYYVNNQAQEAGRFFREYQKHPDLKSTFPQDIPANFNTPKKVKVMGSAQHVGQTKLMSRRLTELLKQGADPQDTLIVLPDEKLLLPVLHGVAGRVENMNVTMGFPLASTPVFNLVEFLVELQQYHRNGLFNHRQVLSLLSHPYLVAADPSHAYHTRKAILEKNQVSVPGDFLDKGPSLYGVLFRPMERQHILNYLREVLISVGSLESITPLDKEYVFQGLTLVNRLKEVMGTELIQGEDVGTHQKEMLKSFMRLFRQLGRTQKIPFTGEPLKGLQIMGVLETRNLDFKNVFVLSLNEGALPSSGSKASYIPFNIRKAYGLPTAEHQDAMYAYLFYRVLQRAENVHLFYNTEPDILGQGEMSRFLQQLLVESGWKVKPEILHTPIEPQPVTPIRINKDERVLEALMRLNEGSSRFKGISPSALNSYIDCSLQFYFKQVAKLREASEVEDYVDSRLFGNLLHHVMEKFYRRIQDKNKSTLVQSTDFERYKDVVRQLIDDAFVKHYGLDPTRKVVYQGQTLVAREVIRSFVEKVLEHDKAYTPFHIEGLERGEWQYFVPIPHAPGRVILSGKIDRLDRKENTVRILDYKTGKADLNFDSIDALFDGSNNKRNRAAFQTLIYSLLYKAGSPGADIAIVPGLVSRQNLFTDDFRPNLTLDKEEVTDANRFLPDFEARLKQLLEEIFDPSKPFVQTEHTSHCKLCAFKGICYR